MSSHYTAGGMPLAFTQETFLFNGVRGLETICHIIVHGFLGPYSCHGSHTVLHIGQHLIVTLFSRSCVDIYM